MISRPSKVQNQPRSPRDHRQQRTGAAGLFGRLEEPYHGQPGETGRAVVPTGFSTPYPAAGLVTAREDAGPNPPPFSAIVRRTKTPMTGRKDGRIFGMGHAHPGNLALTPRKDGDLFESRLEAPRTANAAGCKHRSATGRKDGHLFRCHRRTPAGGEIPAAGPFCMQSLGLKPGAPGLFGLSRAGVFSISSARFGEHNRAGGRGPGSRRLDFHRVVEKPASWPVCPGWMGGRGRASAIVPGSGSRSAPRRAASPGNVRRLDVEKRGGAEAPRCEKE